MWACEQNAKTQRSYEDTDDNEKDKEIDDENKKIVLRIV